MAPAPHWLWPPKPFRQPLPRGHLKPVDGLSPDGSATIESACNAIVTAGAGQQERVLNAESFSIGTAVGGGIIPGDIAFRTLLCSAPLPPCRTMTLPGHGALRKSTSRSVGRSTPARSIRE